jgi:hypothetical protein
MAVFWAVAPCALVYFYQRFGVRYCLHDQGDEAVRTSETSINLYQRTRRYSPEDGPSSGVGSLFSGGNRTYRLTKMGRVCVLLWIAYVLQPRILIQYKGDVWLVFRCTQFDLRRDPAVLTEFVFFSVSPQVDSRLAIDVRFLQHPSRCIVIVLCYKVSAIVRFISSVVS